MFAFDPAAEVATLLAGLPSRLAFRALCSILDRWLDQPPDLIAACAVGLESWPDDTRQAPWTWVAALESGYTKPTWSLVRSFELNDRHLGTAYLDLPDPRAHPELAGITALTVPWYPPDRLRSVVDTVADWCSLRSLTVGAMGEQSAAEIEKLSRSSAIRDLDELHLVDLRDALFHFQPPPFRPPTSDPSRLRRVTMRAPDLTHLLRAGLLPDLRSADVLIIDRKEARELAACPALAQLEHLGLGFRCDHDGRSPLGEPGFGNVLVADELACADFFKKASLGALRSLTLMGKPMGRAREGLGRRGIKRVIRSGVLAQLTALKLEILPLGDEALVPLVERLDPEGLQQLALVDVCARDGTATALASKGHFPRLRLLDLSRNRIGAEGAVALANNVSMPQLEELDLSGCRDISPYYSAREIQPIGDRGVTAWASSPNAGQLRRLNLTCTAVSNAGVRSVVTSGSLEALTDLNLSFNVIGSWPRDLHDAPLWQTLRSLNLAECDLDDTDVESLVTTTSAPQLRQLVLAYNSFGARGARALSEWNVVPQLHEMDLHDNAIGGDGLLALARSRACQRLLELDLDLDCWNSKHHSFGPDVGSAITDPASFPSLDTMFLGLIDEYHGARYTSGVPAAVREAIATSSDVRPEIAATFAHLDIEGEDEPVEMSPEWEAERADHDFRTHRNEAYREYVEQANSDGLNVEHMSRQVRFGG